MSWNANFAQVCMVPKLDVGMLLELLNFTGGKRRVRQVGIESLEFLECSKDLRFGIFESNLRSLCQDPIRTSAS